MTTLTKTGKEIRMGRPFGTVPPLPGLLIAYSPVGSVGQDRCGIKTPFEVGRSHTCSLTMIHNTVSGRHFRISRSRDAYFVEDLNSTNHTYLNGELLVGKQPLPHHGVIRAGQGIFVFHKNARTILESVVSEPLDMVGNFYLGELIQQLKEAEISGRHLLLEGPSGAGKERAAEALGNLLGKGRPHPFCSYNSARFTSEEEMETTLFGVLSNVFSGVSARAGLIEEAEGGVLFLDEVHNLPSRVQRSLLRVIEEGKFSRIGENGLRPCRVRFVFAVNEPGPTFGIASDLLARLRVVSILPLKERLADIPVLFDHLLKVELMKLRIPLDSVFELLEADHYESLMLDGFGGDNVRGLINVANLIASSIGTGTQPQDAIAEVFAKQFRHSPVAIRYRQKNRVVSRPRNDVKPQDASHYEIHKNTIVDCYRECEGNVSATERMLKGRGVLCSRRWLGAYLKKWGILPMV